MATGVDKLFATVSYLREAVHPDFAMSQVALFLLVALNNGITMPEIAEKLNMPVGAVSKNVTRLSKRLVKIDGVSKLVGYDLIQAAPDLEERRRYSVTLTQKGHKIIHELEKLHR